MSSSKTRVAFLGPLASFSHQAAVEAFGDATTCDLQPKLSFADAFAALQSHAVDYAVIPFENSTNGSVVQTLDLLADRRGQYADIVVCGEHYLTVHQCLLMRRSLKRIATPARFPSVRRLYTHPQAWGQCERFLSTHFRGVERQDTPSTSKAAAIVASLPPSEEDSCAAIASSFAADVHGETLIVAAENIEDLEGNTTRFLVLGVKTGGSHTRKIL
ncbi:prephenate dehydratase [Ascosphaera atra]|nr:prephenate dehydratase [Ascosphaera atra]